MPFLRAVWPDYTWIDYQAEQFSPYQEYRSNLHIWNYTYNTWNLASYTGRGRLTYQEVWGLDERAHS